MVRLGHLTLLQQVDFHNQGIDIFSSQPSHTSPVEEGGGHKQKQKKQKQENRPLKSFISMKGLPSSRVQPIGSPGG